jgi:hypothetical protein
MTKLELALITVLEALVLFLLIGAIIGYINRDKKESITGVIEGDNSGIYTGADIGEPVVMKTKPSNCAIIYRNDPSGETYPDSIVNYIPYSLIVSLAKYTPIKHYTIQQLN